jgi:hypothetical protein
MDRVWTAYDLGDTGGYRDIVMHRHARHDITLMQENESGEWSGWLRVSGDDITEFSDPKDLPTELVGKLLKLAKEKLR